MLQSKLTEPLRRLLFLSLVVILFCHIMYFNVHISILHVQWALTCVSRELWGVLVFSLIEQPDPLATLESSKVAEQKRLFVSWPSSRPSSSFQDRKSGNPSLIGTFDVLCCFKMHTTQWTKFCQGTISAHFSAVYFCHHVISDLISSIFWEVVFIWHVISYSIVFCNQERNRQS